MEAPEGSGGAAAAVCCMCGDHGLPGELFQCGLCCLRLQHRYTIEYCSELYPREAAYQSCNWCLREESSGGRDPPVKTTPTAAFKRSRRESGDTMMPSYGCSRTVFSVEPGKPVKKLKKKKGSARRMTEQRPVTSTEAANGRKEGQDGAGGKTRFRVKVRRYKLLAEVIC
ncbi:hypothetical protein QOZ80_2AG0134780 [Eleusine coracana subsp. coracana]|nr:hypothetical protein QOZ80_2AG0134780 [Eleusine coracana subsp. coracana]